MSGSDAEPRPRLVSAFEEWSVDASGHVMTVAWVGSRRAVEIGLVADEDHDEVRLTAWYEERPMPPRTANGFPRRQIKSAREHVASARLEAPLGDRTVVDCERPDELQGPRRRSTAWLRRTAISNIVLGFDGADVVSFQRDGHDQFDVTIACRPSDVEAIKAAIQRECGPGIRLRRWPTAAARFARPPARRTGPSH